MQIEKTIDDKIELTASIKDVSSQINEIISSDFVLCKLNSKEKEFIIEMTNNAFLSKKIMDLIIEKSKRWEWNKKTKEWEHNSLTDKELKKMNMMKEALFNSYLNKLRMIAILNRNVPSNYILEKITGVVDQVNADEDINKLEETRLQKIMNKMKGKSNVKDMNKEDNEME